MADIVVHGKATSNLIQDVDHSVHLADQCRDVTLQCIDLFSNYQTRSLFEMKSTINNPCFVILASSSIDYDKQTNELIRQLNTLIDKSTTLLPKVR